MAPCASYSTGLRRRQTGGGSRLLGTRPGRHGVCFTATKHLQYFSAACFRANQHIHDSTNCMLFIPKWPATESGFLILR